jgi:hypothetical protein
VEVLDSITQIEHPDDAVSVWPVHVMRGTKGQHANGHIDPNLG